MKHRSLGLFALLLSFTLAGCGGGGGGGGDDDPGNPTLNSISISSTPSSPFTPGAFTRFIATGNYSDGSTEQLTEASWSLSNTVVGTLNPSNGDFTATSDLNGLTAVGANLTVTHEGRTRTIPIQVGTGNPVVGLSITSSPRTSPFDINQTTTFTANLVYADNTTQALTPAQANLALSTSALGTLNASTGLFTAVSSLGGQQSITGTVTAAYGGFTTSLNIQVGTNIPSTGNVTITGTARTDTGASLSNVTFAFVDANNQLVGTATTTSSGTFSRSVPNNTRYLYVVSAPSTVYREFRYDRRSNRNYQPTSDCKMRLYTSGGQPVTTLSAGSVGTFTFYSNNGGFPPPFPEDCDL